MVVMKICIYLVVMFSSLEWKTFKMIDFATGHQGSSACNHICSCSVQKYGVFLVNCSYRQLSRIPANIPENVTKLNLSFNYLQLKAGDLSDYPVLTDLSLASNDLKVLPRIFWDEKNGSNGLKGTQNHLENLRYIDLSSNHLTSVPKSLLGGLPALRTVFFQENFLKNVPDLLFQKNDYLEYVNLAHNNITEVSGSIFSSLKSAKVISLKNNGLSFLPEMLFMETRQLFELDLSWNRLQYLPEQLLKNTLQLKLLDLSGNYLLELPEMLLKNTPDLSFFFCNDNKVKTIPPMLMANTPIIDQISFSQNNLRSISKDMFPSEYDPIIYLSFSGNNLHSIPNDILWNIPRLSLLDFSDNKISSIPEELFQYVNMRTQFDISNNLIRELPNRLFDLNEKYHDLQLLFLNYNHLTFVQRDIFYGIPRLRVLSLFGNKIATFDSAALAMDSLEAVFIFNNSLTELSQNLLGENSVTSIHAYGNEITTISGNFTRPVRINSTMYINCNYLTDVQQHSIKLTCVSPSFSPEIRLGVFQDDDPILKFFQLEGFSCYRKPSYGDVYCKACPRGTYSDKFKCIPCPKGGFYQDEIGAKAADGDMYCKKCPNGTYVATGKGLSQKDCILCPGGTLENRHAGFRACFCKDGFSRRERFGECNECIQKGLSCTGQDYQSLQPGYFWNWSFPNASIKEYDNFAANLRNETESYNNNTVFYFMEIPRVHKCLRTGSCINKCVENSTKSVDSVCSAGHAGWLCSKCQYGYYPFLSMCLSCPENIITVLEVVGTFCLCFGLTVVICWQYKKPHNTSINNRSVNIVVARIKILLGFYQVLMQILFTYQGIETATIVEKVISFFEVNFIRMSIRLKCLDENFTINPKSEFVFAVLFIFMFTAIPLLYYITKANYMKIRYQVGKTNKKLVAMRDKVLTTAVLMLFVTYPSICSSIFQLYPTACVRFCLDLSNRHCFTVLSSDMDIPCDSKLRYYQVFAIVLTIGYVLTFPAILLFLLRKYYSALNDSEKKQNNDFKIPVCHSLPVWVRFISENYKYGFWYWEIIELARKVTQTALITLFGWKDELIVLMTVGTSVIFLTLHAKYMPMRCNQEQWLQVFSLCIIVINVVCLGVQIPIEYKYTTWWILAMLNSSLVLITIVETFFRVLFRLKDASLYWKYLLILSRRTDKAEYQSTNH